MRGKLQQVARWVFVLLTLANPLALLAADDLAQQAQALAKRDAEAALEFLRATLADTSSESATERSVLIRTRGEILRDTGQHELAKKSALEAIRLAKLTGQPDLVARALTLQGSIEVELGAHAMGIERFHEARTMLESLETPAPARLARVYNAIGVAYSQLEPAHIAAEYFHEAAALAKKAGDIAFEILARGNLATTMAKQGDLEDAVQEHRKVLAMAQEYDQPVTAGYQQANLCEHLVNLELFDEAEQNCLAASRTLAGSEHVRFIAGIRMLLGDIAAQRNDYASAIEFYQLSLELAVGRVQIVEVEALEKLAKTLLQTQEFESAARHYLQLTELYKHIWDQRREDIAAELDARYRNERARDEIELLQLGARLREAELENRNRVILVLVAGLITSAVLALIAGYNYRGRASLDGQLQERNTELETALAQIREQAVRDPLTGLLNRRGFHSVAEYALAQQRRDGTSLSVAIADIDYFKQLNDDYGHSIGDEVLKEVARRACAQIRAVDVACRWGGEEFVILFPKADLDEAARISERILSALRKATVQTSGGNFPVRVSVGIASVDGDIDTAIHNADQAMYRAKRNGRDRIAIFDD